MEFNGLTNRLELWQSDLKKFRVEFFDSEKFRGFVNNLYNELDGFMEICITGYFSETIRNTLDSMARGSPRRNIRLLSPMYDPESKRRRDKQSLNTLRKLGEAGVKVKLNDRLHARFLVAFNRYHKQPPKVGGFLVIGSFDFNKEGFAAERYDAGLKTQHPDLVQSAMEFFEKVWKDHDSQALDEFRKDRS